MLQDNLIGREVGDFRIEERIGRGGMASVYRAYQSSVNRFVALKVIYPDFGNVAEYDTFRKRFALEAEVIARLEHIHILPIFAYGVDEHLAYLAMRLLNGGSLHSRLENGRPMPLEVAVGIFDQIAQGLSYAHSKGVIHRDLKPSNIMFDETGNAYLTDFGLAKWREHNAELTKSGNIVGTPAFMAPEQLRGDTIDHRADIYSMGIIFYHMVVGHPPYEISSTDVISLIYHQLERDPRPPTQLNQNLPASVEKVLLRSLRKNPDERYGDIRQMMYELDLAMGRTPNPARFGSSPFVPEPLTETINIRRRRRNLNRRLIAIALIAALVMVAGLLLLFNQSAEAPLPTPQVLVASSPAESIVPTEAELDIARNALSNSFIAYITCNQTSEYHATQAREIGDFARAYNLDYRVYDSDNDAYTQVTQIEKARTDGARALIICPLDPSRLAGALQSVEEAQVPLVMFTSGMPFYGGVQLVGDEYLLGRKPGELAGQIIRDEMGGEANVIILHYPDLEAIVTRANGLEEGILALAPNANIIGRYQGAIREVGRATVSRLIQGGVQFNVIASINDAGSLGAVEALEDAGIGPDKVMIVSVDAEQPVREYISEGYYFRGSVEPGRRPNSVAAVDAIVKLLAGSPIAQEIRVPPGDMITAETFTD